VPIRIENAATSTPSAPVNYARNIKRST